MTAVLKKDSYLSRPGAGDVHSSVRSTFADLDLPGFIGQMLDQYQGLLVGQVERDVKSKALATMTQEARALHFQVRERLRSIESEMQQGIQTVVNRARETIFEMVREEVGATFAELETRLEDHFRDADREVSAVDRRKKEEEQPRPPGPAVETPASRLAGDVVVGPTAEVGDGPQMVCLDLPPPLDLRPLVDFYRGLSEIKEIRVLRAVGSVKGGVSVYVRPKETCSLQQLLGALPGVRVMDDEVSQTGSDRRAGEEMGHLALRIRLASTEQEVGDGMGMAQPITG